MSPRISSVFLVCGDGEYAVTVEMRLERLGVDVRRQCVGPVHFARNLAVGVASNRVTSVHHQLVTNHSHLNFFGREKLAVQVNLEAVFGVQQLDNTVVVLQRPVPLLTGPVVSERNHITHVVK